jgi:hypothetical protein
MLNATIDYSANRTNLDKREVRFGLYCSPSQDAQDNLALLIRISQGLGYNATGLVQSLLSREMSAMIIVGI